MLMNRLQLGAGSATAGAGVLATCLCSTAKFTLGGLALAGGVVAVNVHAALILLAAGFVMAGLATRSPGAAMRAGLGFALLAGGYLLAPPAVMSRTAIHTPSNLLGFGLTLAGVAAVVWAFLMAFPTRHPRAATFAAGGFGAAAGCSCCMATGALVWLGAAAGLTVPQSPFADGLPFALFMGIAVAALHRLAGRRVALLALAGAVVAFAGDEALKPLLPDDIERFPRLLATLAGMMIVAGAFARAFEGARSPTAPAPLTSEPNPELIGF
jgi:hypothetical protein